MKKTEKSKSNRSDLVIFAIILATVFLFNFIIISFAFFSNKQILSGNITLGEIDFSIVESGDDSVLALPSHTIQKSIVVGNYRNSNKLDYSGLGGFFLRFSVKMLVDNVASDTLLQNTSFLGQQNFVRYKQYYYFCGELKAGQEVQLFDKIEFSNKVDNKFQQKKVVVDLCIEAIQSQNNAYLELWPDFPPEWQQQIKTFDY